VNGAAPVVTFAVIEPFDWLHVASTVFRFAVMLCATLTVPTPFAIHPLASVTVNVYDVVIEGVAVGEYALGLFKVNPGLVHWYVYGAVPQHILGVRTALPPLHIDMGLTVIDPTIGPGILGTVVDVTAAQPFASVTVTL
jgi:hypothetical protein